MLVRESYVHAFAKSKQCGPIQVTNWRVATRERRQMAAPPENCWFRCLRCCLIAAFPHEGQAEKTAYARIADAVAKETYALPDTHRCLADDTATSADAGVQMAQAHGLNKERHESVMTARAEELASVLAVAARRANKMVGALKVVQNKLVSHVPFWKEDATPEDEPLDYLLLGLSLEALQEALNQLPSNAADHFLSHSPDFKQTGHYGWSNPGARVVNGYVLQHHLQEQGEGGRSYCERVHGKHPCGRGDWLSASGSSSAASLPVAPATVHIHAPMMPIHVRMSRAYQQRC